MYGSLSSRGRYLSGPPSSEEPAVVAEPVSSESGEVVASSSPRPTLEQSAARAYEAAKEIGTELAYEVVVRRYPESVYAELSRAQMAKLAEESERREVGAGGGVVTVESEVEAERQRVDRVFRDCEGGWCPELVVVPGGTYQMGSPSSERGRNGDEGPVHEVTIGEPIAVGVREVTVGEWRRFVDETGYSAGNLCRKYEQNLIYDSIGKWNSRRGLSWRNPGYEQGSKHPVVCVNWHDAKAYVKWLSRETGEEYRLLTESEWEYVARGGTRTSRYWGDSEAGQCRYANGPDRAAKRKYMRTPVASCDDGYVRTSPVGSFEANEYGLHDVLGNVWEWVEDCWNVSYRGAPRDGSAWEGGDCSVRVVRGGGWLDLRPRSLRSANRSKYSTGGRYDNIGFRVVRTLTP